MHMDIPILPIPRLPNLEPTSSPSQDSLLPLIPLREQEAQSAAKRLRSARALRKVLQTLVVLQNLRAKLVHKCAVLMQHSQVLYINQSYIVTNRPLLPQTSLPQRSGERALLGELVLDSRKSSKSSGHLWELHQSSLERSHKLLRQLRPGPN